MRLSQLINELHWESCNLVKRTNLVHNFSKYVFCSSLHVKKAASVVSGLACWPLVPKFVDSNPAEAFGFLRAEEILSTPSFGREVKPWVPCRRFAACKRTLNVLWKSALRQNYRSLFPPISSNFRH
jgi:hypothetical protein